MDGLHLDTGHGARTYTGAGVWIHADLMPGNLITRGGRGHQGSRASAQGLTVIITSGRTSSKLWSGTARRLAWQSGR
jgi:hypothetical protein